MKFRRTRRSDFGYRACQRGIARGQFYGVWCKDARGGRGDWLRFPDESIVAYESKRAAWSRAAGEYGFPTYTEAKRKDWVEVRPLGRSRRSAP